MSALGMVSSAQFDPLPSASGATLFDAPSAPSPYPPGAPGAAASDPQGIRPANPNVYANQNQSGYAPQDGLAAERSASLFPQSTARNAMNAQQAADTQPRYGPARYSSPPTWKG